MQKVFAVSLIYLASWCYVIAAFYHLKLQNWTFLKAMAIAVPAVLVEYTLSLNGNRLANISMSPVQILILTVGFYVLNIILLNLFVLKGQFSPARDLLAVSLVFAAIVISTNARL